MVVYIFFFIFLILGAVAFEGKSTPSFLKWILISLWVIIGFRSPEVGVDTKGYIESFHLYSTMSTDAFICHIKEAKEPLYILGSWLVGQLSSSQIVFLLFWAFIPSAVLYVFLKEARLTSKGILISFLCFFALGLFAFFLAGIRQTAAISVVLLAYRSLTKEKFKWNYSFITSKQFIMFLVWMYIAYNLHNSSILFLLVLPLLKLKVKWWYFPVVISFFFIGSFIQIGFLVEMSKLLFDDRFANYGTIYESSQNASAFLMQLIFFTICYIKRNELIETDYRNNYLFNVLLLGLIFQSMSGMLAEMFRVAYYFSIFAIILVPKAIKEYKPSLQKMLYVGMSVLLLIYLFFLSGSSIPEYSSSLF